MFLRRAVNEYLRHLRVARQLSANSVRDYRHYLNRLTVWCEEKQLTKVENLSAEDILDWQVALTDQGVGAKTQNYHLIAVRGLLRFLINKDLPVLAPDKIVLGKNRARVVNFFEPEELMAVIASIPPEAPHQQRDRAIISVLFSSGLRVGELVELKRNQVSLKRGEISVVGKGGRARLVFLTKQALAELQEYLKTRHDGNPFVFVHQGRNGEVRDLKRGLTARTIQRLIRRWGAFAGLAKPITPHKLRHSFATDILRNAADLRAVQAMLGHSSLTTTQIYTHVTNTQLKAIHDKFHSQNKED